MNIEKTILSNLIYNEEYSRKVLPFLKDEYFNSYSDKIVFKLIDIYFNKYNDSPSKEALLIDLSNVSIDEQGFKNSKQLIETLERDNTTNQEWLLNNTETFCQDSAIHNALIKAIEIKNDKTGKLGKGAIPQLLTDALAVSFDNRIGHDYMEDSNSRFDYYHRKEARIPCDIEYFNLITKGGFPLKSLNVFLAPTGVGKSLFMCHLAATQLTMGYNVLYITLEMSEEEISKRVDTNLLNVTFDELDSLDKSMYDQKINRLKSKITGKLIVKEYPTACAGSANFRHLINELKIKKKFVPDIVYIDYINICCSSRIKMGNNVNSYTLVKSIAEELRGLGVEYNVPIVSATQVNRAGFGDSDIDLDNTSESFGLPMTVDFMCALIANEDLEKMGQVLVKQLKTRYTNMNIHKKFVVGVDKDKMRLYNVEQKAQEDIIDGPVMDNAKFGQEDHQRSLPKSKFHKFRSFK